MKSSEPEWIVDWCKENLRYDAPTGQIYWLKRAHGRPVDRPAGCQRDTMGYRSLRTGGRNYLIHRLVWVLVNGVLPTHEIDHINGIKSDNRIENLRDVPHTHNQQNIRRNPSDNKYAKTVGVTPCQKTGKWRARLTVDGKLKSFGSYLTIQEAEEAYKEAKRKHHPGWFG